MKDILEALSVPLLLESIFHPFIALHHEIDAISLNKHQTRSTSKILIMTTTVVTGIYLFFNNQAINSFFFKITAAFNLSAETQPTVSACLAILAAFHVGSYVSNVLVRSFCNFTFGDPDFYVTKNRAIKLQEQFKEQGNDKITEKHIYEVVDFCRKNLRRQLSNDLGTKHEDWKKTLESLLYDADLEHFLDQQQALKAKKTELQRKLNAISAYTNYYSPMTPMTPMIAMHSSRKPKTPKIPCFPEETTETTETTPLLIEQNNTVCYNQTTSQSESNSGLEELAMKEIKKFKSHHLKKEKYYVAPSEECLLQHCKHHLKTLELKTERAIYPESLIIKLLCLPEYTESEPTLTPETTPSTNELQSPLCLNKTQLRPQF